MRISQTLLCNKISKLPIPFRKGGKNNQNSAQLWNYGGNTIYFVIFPTFENPSLPFIYPYFPFFPLISTIRKYSLWNPFFSDSRLVEKKPTHRVGKVLIVVRLMFGPPHFPPTLKSTTGQILAGIPNSPKLIEIYLFTKGTTIDLKLTNKIN